MAAAGAAQSVEQTFPAIRTALELLGDGHSLYRPVTGTSISAARACVAPNADTPALPPTVGYVRVGAFSGSAAEATAFANAVQGAIASADRDGLAGWIVDVRGNGGGNMWPMLAGVGPVLGAGRVGYFIDALGAASAWEYRDGGSWLSGVLLQSRRHAVPPASGIAEGRRPHRRRNRAVPEKRSRSPFSGVPRRVRSVRPRAVDPRQISNSR